MKEEPLKPERLAVHMSDADGRPNAGLQRKPEKWPLWLCALNIAWWGFVGWGLIFAVLRIWGVV